MQVSKGLKRATGRDEQVQHYFGTLNFLDLRILPIYQHCHPERSHSIRLRME
jgi:hypothetical protein